MKKRIAPNNATPGTMKIPAPNGKKPTDIRLHTRLSKQHYEAKSKGKIENMEQKNFSNLQDKVNKAKEVLDRVQMAIQANPLDTQLASIENTTLKEYNAATKEEVASAKQKAGAIWALLGDDNTEFFHKCIKGK
ncbi:hypothetical protein FRX31_024199 [Thalictrum thalictroides]|uniref:Uncharacterized protein n=1 Tax=Thalictrum thalictroides TaxID=46969 RepID=A0A7J6VN78_THATH|nr:hypothetical protein FRX31_024199 [Thalictrum thalictroides]